MVNMVIVQYFAGRVRSGAHEKTMSTPWSVESKKSVGLPKKEWGGEE